MAWRWLEQEWCEPGREIWPQFEKMAAKLGGLEPLPEPPAPDSDEDEDEAPAEVVDNGEPPPPRKLKVPAFLFAAVDTEAAPATTETAGVKCIPTIHLYRKVTTRRAQTRVISTQDSHRCVWCIGFQGELAATISGGKSAVKEFLAAVEELAEENGVAALALAEAKAAADAAAAASPNKGGKKKNK